MLVIAGIAAWPAYGMIQKVQYPLKYEREVYRWAEEYQLDPYLIFAVIRTESGFDPKAQSSAGAIGLMQMTEDTFEWLCGKIAPQEELVFDDLYTPDTSIRFGAYFISYCLARYENDVATAAAAYHSGTGAVDKLLMEEKYSTDGIRLSNFPYGATGHYVDKIQRSYQKYLSLYKT